MLRSVRLSARSLARSPGFTVPALLILAIGMTAATAVFTVVDSIAFRPLDLPESDRLVLVCEEHPRLQGYCIASPGQVEDFRQATRTLSDLGIGRTWEYALSDRAGATGVSGGLATAGFLRALGVKPALGRLFVDDEHGPDNDKVVLLSHALWTTRFGSDPDVVGSTLDLDEEPYTVVGVLPAGFEAPFDMAGVQLWKPPHFDPLDPEVRGWRGFAAVGRLAPGVELAAAADELTAVYAGIAEQHEEVNDEWRLRVSPLLDIVVGDTRPVLLAFLGAAALLVLIVCANVANLLLARGLGRRQELAVRAALGAARSRLVGEILIESLVLTLAATAVAVVLAVGATRVLLLLAPREIPRLDEVAMDGRVFAFAALLSVGATALFAVLPALRVTAWNLAQTVRSGGRGGEGRSSNRLRNALVVAELALSVVLLASAGLLVRSFAAYLAWTPGFERTSLLTVSAFANVGKYDSREQLFSMWRQAEEQVAAVPGVTSVATASAGPLFGGGDGAAPYVVEGADESGELPSARWFDVGPGYFRTLGIAVTEGREITEADRVDVAPVAVVNEAMARAAWPGENALGKQVRFPEHDVTFEVVGVVADVDPLTPGQPPAPEIYWSNRQLGRPATFFLVRTGGDAAALSRAVSDALLSVDPDLSLGAPRTLASQESRELVRPRFQAVVMLAFALAALALSAVGVYAVVAYAVARRVREMGIRMALGARAPDVVGLMVRSSLGVTLAGVALGVVGALFAGRLLQGVIHGVSPADPVSLGGAAVLLALAATAAAWVPARRATRADPLSAIRSE
ncbi:MAG: ABC transporter permease [Longimicrobiales bacterium]|nr:ABC transporter permease [Longimicrobiales bacterium]